MGDCARVEFQTVKSPEIDNSSPFEARVRTIEAWLVQKMLGQIFLKEVFSEFAAMIDGHLFPLLRAHVTMRELHPFYRTFRSYLEPGRDD